MTSVLKRKRGSVGALETPKRTKSAKNTQSFLAENKLQQSGWDSAFNPPTEIKDLVHTNGVNGDSPKEGKEGSPEAEDYENFVELERKRQLERRQVLKEEKRLLRSITKTTPATWKVSEPIGGRMINVDPVFTADEKFLLVANRSTIHVYSTTTSLLTRSIKPEIDFTTRRDVRIITYCLSPTNTNLVWVACSDGAIYCIDWTTGEGTDKYWGVSSTGCIHMTVASMESAGRRRDVVFTTEIRKDGGWRITANGLAPPGGPIETLARTIYTSTHEVNFLKTANEGAVIAAAAGNKVVLGVLRSTEYDTIDKIRYEFRVFESADVISSLDIKVSVRPGVVKVKKAKKRLPIVDVVVGDVKGAIFIHDDLWANLVGENGAGISIMPRKLHWHRQGVQTVKYSQDGNYVISGGTETVLVQWQLDTGSYQFLPHMGSTIQNVVVSPSGASYGVQLADNSTMVLSVADLLPSANIAGLQANVLTLTDPIDSLVRRVDEKPTEYPYIQRTPAVISPLNPSRLLLGVGQLQEISNNNPRVKSVPFLQTFDLGAGHNISRQALTRTNLTSIAATPDAHRVSEPRIVHMKLSFDGKWLATVDEWLPPKQDVQFIAHQGTDIGEERRNRREVFLKFWQWSEEEQIWELVSRINDPHSSEDSTGAPRVLDLATDPSSLRFSTIGEDGYVRTWTPKTRKRDGIVVRGPDGIALRNWHCQHETSTGKAELNEPDTNQQPLENGAVAFSDDGSLIAAATGSDGILHLLDSELGTIRSTRTHMYSGPILALAFLGQDLITLSDHLHVYDLVIDTPRYIITLSPSSTTLTTTQKLEMTHLATDPKSNTYAVVLPASLKSSPASYDLLAARYSELAVFHQDSREPVFQEKFGTVITALIPNAGSEGYLILDSAAEIRTVLKKGSQTITALAQSEAALKLDQLDDEPVTALVEIDEEADEGIELPAPTADAVEDESDDDETPVVSQQQLADIFDIGPSFAMPPMEEMFYQVAGLFSSLPVAQSV